MEHFIQGINILEQTEIIKPAITMTVLLVISLLSVVASLFYFSWTTRGDEHICTNDKRLKNALTGFVICVIIFVIAILPFPWNYEATGLYTYKCTIEENVSASYLAKHFEIIDVTNGVWTLEDIETE